MNTYREYCLGDMLARYVTDEQGHTGLMLLPASRSADVLDKKWAVESLVQCHARGDQLPNGYGNGDMLVNITVYVPQNLNREEREAIEKLRGSENMSPSESEKRNIFSRLRHIFS